MPRVVCPVMYFLSVSYVLCHTFLRPVSYVVKSRRLGACVVFLCDLCHMAFVIFPCVLCRIFLCLVSCVACPASCHLPCVIYLVPCNVCLVSCVVFSCVLCCIILSYFLESRVVSYVLCPVPYILYLVSYVLYPLPYVSCIVSPVSCILNCVPCVLCFMSRVPCDCTLVLVIPFGYKMALLFMHPAVRTVININDYREDV